MALVEQHGIVLESAKGPVPSLASEIAGEEIQGSWWGHAEAEHIWSLTRGLRGSENILVCRLIVREGDLRTPAAVARPRPAGVTVQRRPNHRNNRGAH